MKGKLGGPCDTDFFAFRVPQGVTLTTTLVNQAGGTCQGIEASELRLLNSNFVQVARVAGTCPVFDATTTGNLAAGEYLLAIRTSASGPNFDYFLTVGITGP